jgi:hypothetical protein
MVGSTHRSTDRITAGEGNAVHQLRAAMEETADNALQRLTTMRPQLRSRNRRRKIARGFHPDNNQPRRRADRGVGGAGERGSPPNLQSYSRGDVSAGLRVVDAREPQAKIRDEQGLSP